MKIYQDFLNITVTDTPINENIVFFAVLILIVAIAKPPDYKLTSLILLDRMERKIDKLLQK